MNLRLQEFQENSQKTVESLLAVCTGRI